MMSSSYATGNMSVYDTGNRVWNLDRKRAGGLVGSQGASTDWVAGTFASYATGQVSGVLGVGGLVGSNSGRVVASYATGPVTGQSAVGGLVGSGGPKASVKASYSTGAVDGEKSVGGLLGSANQTRQTSAGLVQSHHFNYWDIESSGITPEDPRQVSIGPDESFPGIDGKTTAELKAPTGYTGIYADWNTDLDNADGEEVHLFGVELDLDTARSNGADDFWDFGDSNHYPALKVDFDGDGIATWQEFGDQRPGACLPAPAGAPQPTAEGTAASATAAGATPAAQASSAAAPGATASASQAAEEQEGTAVSATAERAAAAASDGAAAATPEPGSAAESGGGGCGAPPEDAPPGATAGSLLLLLAPLAMIGGLKWQARRRRDGGNVFFRRCA